MCAAFNCAPLNTLTLTGTLRTFSLRFWAVTVISSTLVFDGGGAVCAVAAAMARKEAPPTSRAARERCISFPMIAVAGSFVKGCGGFVIIIPQRQNHASTGPGFGEARHLRGRMCCQ